MEKLLPDYLPRLKAYEGLRCKAYKPVGEKPSVFYTIGYGHYGASEGDRITPAEAHELLCSDVQAVCDALRKSCPDLVRRLNSSRFTAVVDFVFNVGLTNFKRSTLYRKMLRNLDDPSIANEWRRWTYSAKRYLPGLAKRREYCISLWFDSDQHYE